MSFQKVYPFTTEDISGYLTQIDVENKKVLTVGSSGDQALNSLLLGAKSATAVDIDPNCVHIAYDNAERNKVDKSKYRVLAGNVLEDEKLKAEIADTKYDVVVANIVADVIIAFAPIVPELIKKGGTFITSGIIIDRAEEVKAVLLEQGFKDITVTQRKDWVSMKCTY